MCVNTPVMVSNLHAEVLVTGAGPVGMLTALLLGESGIRTHIIDQETRPALRSYACALHPHSLGLLDRAGVAGDAIDLGWIVDTIGFYEGKSCLGRIGLTQLPVEFPFVLVLPQSRLEAFLEERLRQLPNVRFDWNWRLESLRQDNHGVTAMIDDLAPAKKGAEAEEKQWTIAAEFVAGADGHNSTIRQCLGLQPEKTGRPDHFVVYEFETDPVLDHEMKVLLAGPTTSVIWPLASDRCRCSFQMDPKHPGAHFPKKERAAAENWPVEPADHRRQLEQLLAERAPWFDRDVNEPDWAVDIQFEHWVAEHFGRGRCWLAGDAAHQTGPLAMQSMNLGLGEAADLAAILKRILRQGGAAELLQNYQHRHLDSWRKLLGLTGATKINGDAPAWAGSYIARMLAALPVSRNEMPRLLSTLGIEIN